MFKRLLPIFILLLVVMGIVIAFFMMRNNNTSQTAVQDNTMMESKKVPAAGGVDFISAFQGNGSVKCTYDANGASVTSYVKNGKVKYQTASNGVTANGLIIDKTIYSWQEGQSTGFKMDMSSLEAGGETSNQVKDADDVRAEMEQYNPNCSNETITDSMFEPPSEVKFEDMSKMMQDIRSKMPGQ